MDPRAAKLSNQGSRDFERCRSWNDIHEWHRKYTPWLPQTTLKQLMVDYHLQAKDCEETLHKDHEFMLRLDF